MAGANNPSMTMLHSGMSEAVINELDLHGLPPLNLSTVDNRLIEKPPTNSLSDSALQFEVNFEPSSHYTDLRECELTLEYRCVNNADTGLAANDTAAPVNNLLHSLFESIQVLLNNEKITGNNEDYPYKAFFHNLLEFNKQGKEEFLAPTAMYVKDKAKQHDDTAGANTGFTSRRTMALGTGWKTLTGRLCLDIADQHKYIPPNTHIRFLFTRTKRDFYMIEATGGLFQVNIRNPVVSLRHVAVSDVALMEHAKLTKEHGPYNYDINRRKVTQYTLQGGASDHTFQALDSNQIPERIIVGLVSKEAASGKLEKNPFKFDHFKLEELDVSYNDKKHYLRADFANGDAVRAYHQFYVESGLYNIGKNIDLTYEDYMNGTALFAFDFTPDRAPEDANRKNLVKYGTLIFHLKFAQALESPVSVILFSQYDNLIQINETGQVVTDYNML